MRSHKPIYPILAILFLTAFQAFASEADALAISANIRAKHMPFGTILDPYYDSPTGTQLMGYTRCGDSALWTGAFLAAESFRYKVTQSQDALANVKAALAGLKSLSDVTGDNRLARCIVLASSPYAAGIASEEAANTIHQAPPWFWVDNTSRDEVVGAFFGMAVAYDMVNDAGVQTTISNLSTLLLRFIKDHNWTPNDDISNTFELRPEELQMLVQVVRHINPGANIGGPLIVPPVGIGVTVDVQSLSSYFKFNLDYMSLYNLIRYQNNSDNNSAYGTVRGFTASHQNAFFDMIDRALKGPDAARDAEAVMLLNQWLQRPKRDLYVDLSNQVKVCGSEACVPIPVPIRPPTDFLWQRDPFMLTGGSYGTAEGAGIDYILPYWMGRYLGVIQGDTVTVQSAAGAISAIAPSSIASIYGTNLASMTASASAQPLPTILGGVTATVTDASGAALPAFLLYVSAAQINFVIPDGAALGPATFTVTNGTQSQTGSSTISAAAPSLFSADGSGKGVAAAIGLRTQLASPQIQSSFPVYNCTAAGCVAIPIQLGVDTPIYVSFFGTGIRGRSSLAGVHANLNGIDLPVSYAGPAPGFTGLDQVNVGLPLSLRGTGESSVTLTVDGQTANAVTISVQ